MRLVVVVGGLAAAVLSSTAFAGPQFVDREGRADFGYDVVAYHVTQTPTQGLGSYSATYNGATFLFANADNLARFQASPARYAPAYDGHCAYALTRNKKLTVDPLAFSIVDPATFAEVGADYDPLTDQGVLYLNYSPGVNKKFNKDIKGSIAKADEAWKTLENAPAARPEKSVRDLF